MFNERKTAIEVPEKKIRIYDLKVAQWIDEIMALKDPRFKTFNNVVVEGLKHGLPKILEGYDPSSVSDIVKKENDRLISHTNRLYEKLQSQINRVLVSTVLSQELITCVLNEVEQILAQNNIAMTEEMRQQFINHLPEPLDEQYQDFLAKLGLDG